MTIAKARLTQRGGQPWGRRAWRGARENSRRSRPPSVARLTQPQTSRDRSDSRRKASSPSDASRSEEHTSELQSRLHLVCRLLLEKKTKITPHYARRLL